MMNHDERLLERQRSFDRERRAQAILRGQKQRLANLTAMSKVAHAAIKPAPPAPVEFEPVTISRTPVRVTS